MAKIYLHTYVCEKFKYLSSTADRQRVIGCCALMIPSNKKFSFKNPNIIADWSYNKRNESASWIQRKVEDKRKPKLVVDSTEQDLFKQGFDNGHLFGKQLGGDKHWYNLVPMATKNNRAGIWNKMESHVAGHKGFGLYFIRCFYSDKRDPRIPVKIMGLYWPVDNDIAKAIHQKQGVFQNQCKILIASPNVSAASQKISQLIDSFTPVKTKSGIKVKTKNLVSAIPRGYQKPALIVFDQEDFWIRSFKSILNLQKLDTNLKTALRKIPLNWTLETDPLFNKTSGMGTKTTAPQRGNRLEFVTYFSLPPETERPYAMLDYMRLHGYLDNVFKNGCSIPKITISNMKHPSSPEIRALIEWYNLKAYSHLTLNQNVFYSNARDDKGTLQDRLVSEPQIDHIVPQQTKLFSNLCPGPTVFSNLQLTSPRYNIKKSNVSLAFLEFKAIHIGRYVRRSRRARRNIMVIDFDSLKKKDDEIVPRSKRRKVEVKVKKKN